MQTKHTPGPWTFHEQGDANQFCLLTNDKRWVISFGQNGELTTEEQKANATLVSAAPDLLEALQQISITLVQLIPIGSDPKYYELYEKFQQGQHAIKKAIL